MKWFHLAASAALLLQAGTFVNANPLFGEHGNDDGMTDGCQGFRITFPATQGLSFTENSNHLVAWQAPADLGKVSVTLLDSNGQTVDTIGTFDGNQGTTNEVPLHLNGKQAGDYHFHLSSESSDGSPSCQLDSVAFHIGAASSQSSDASSHTSKHWNSEGSSFFTEERHTNTVDEGGWVSEESTQPPENTPDNTHGNAADKHWNSGGSSFYTDEVHNNIVNENGWEAETSTTAPPSMNPDGTGAPTHPNAYEGKNWISSHDDVAWGKEVHLNEEPKTWSSGHLNDVPDHSNEGEWSMATIDNADETKTHGNSVEMDSDTQNDWHRNSIPAYNDENVTHDNVKPAYWTQEKAWTSPSHENVDDEMFDFRNHPNAVLATELSSLNNAGSGWQKEGTHQNEGGWHRNDISLDDTHQNEGGWHRNDINMDNTEHLDAVGWQEGETHQNEGGWHRNDISLDDTHQNEGGWHRNDINMDTTEHLDAVGWQEGETHQNEGGWHRNDISLDDTEHLNAVGWQSGDVHQDAYAENAQSWEETTRIDTEKGHDSVHEASISSTGVSSAYTDWESGHDNYVSDW